MTQIEQTEGGSMLEKLARALAVANHKDPDAPAWVRLPGGYSEGVCWRDQYLPKARAILQALRDPTPEMIEAGVEADIPGGRAGEATFSASVIFEDDALGIWQAMIDAAMEGGG